MSCLSDHSRSGVPTAPRKYLVVTMFAAFTLQNAGNSTPFCSKLIEPSRQFVMTTSRRSHSTSSYGWTPSVVQTRSTRSPPPATLPFVRLRCRPAVMPSPAILLPLIASATRLIPGLAQLSDLLLELVERVEGFVDAGEPEISHLVELS